MEVFLKGARFKINEIYGPVGKRLMRLEEANVAKAGPSLCLPRKKTDGVYVVIWYIFHNFVAFELARDESKRFT